MGLFRNVSLNQWISVHQWIFVCLQSYYWSDDDDREQDVIWLLQYGYAGC